MTLLLATAMVLQALTSAAPLTHGAADPTYARDGRLAVTIRGDLWVHAPGDDGGWVRVTAGPAWDREPAWAADGSALVFASDRGGGSDLWHVRLGPAGPVGEPERLTTSPDWDGEPAAGPDGHLWYVRGRGPNARLWHRAADGTERRLTKSDAGAERWPAVAPGGDRVAYVRVTERGVELRIHWVGADTGRVVLADPAVERPAWSPDGERLAFTTRRGRVGVWVTDTRGRYVNLVSDRAAAPTWAPDGRRLVLADLGPAEVGYNGDPDRVGDRETIDALPGAGALWLVDAPAPPDMGAQSLALAPTDRPTLNAEAFDRMWQRTAQLYYAGPDAAERRAAWERSRAAYRARAVAARDDDELEAVLHEALANRPALRRSATGRAAVSSAHPVATSAGLEILRNGGNAVDAAIAVSFALGVVEPDASGVGGYGQMLIHLPGMPRPRLIEFMTRAPEDAGLGNAGLLTGGAYPDDGPVLANVPGTVAAMELAFKTYGSGKVAWADLLAPAIRAAEDGFAVSDGVATTLALEREHYRKYEAPRALFFRNGEPLAAGDTLRNPDLAWTLRQIAQGGAAAFYHGEVARRMVADLRGHGNAMRLSDVARYFAIEREPVSTTYRGHTIYSSAPPSQGGATLAAQLNLLERFARPRPYREDAATLHAMIEAWKLVPSSRGRIADPGLWPVALDAFTSKDSARVRWGCYDPDRAVTPADLAGDSLPCAAEDVVTGAHEQPACVAHAGGGRVCHQSGTTSFAVGDAAGALVAVTQTLGTWGGNFYVTPGLGFIYNDKLTSYALDPDRYGARLPNARHGSSIAPTLVYRGTGTGMRPIVAAGAAGNRWITSAVYAIVTSVVDHGLDPQRAVELPRFLVSETRGSGERAFVIQLEDGYHPDVIRGLEARGHALQFISLKGELRMGYAGVVMLRDGAATAAGDPRRSGTAGAVGCRDERDQCRR